MRRYAILFFGLIIAITMVSAKVSDMLKARAEKPWMSKRDFATLIDVSYNTPQCATIFICDRYIGSERLFKEFISIYPYPYVVNNPAVDECVSYLMIGRSESRVLEYVKSLISDTHNQNIDLLIIIDNDIKKPRDGNVARTILGDIWYSHVNVNIVARNGLWTLLVYSLYARDFKKVFSYDEMVHPKRILNGENVVHYVMTFYNPPFCFLQTTINRTVFGEKQEVFIPKDESEMDGVEIKLFQLIAERINIRYQFFKLSDKFVIGTRNESVWEGDMIGPMFLRDSFRMGIYVAFGGLWFTQENAEAYDSVKLTVPWTKINLQFLVPRPKPHFSFLALTTPLSLEMWICIIVVLAAQSVCFYMGAWIDPRIPRKYRSFTNAWTDMMAGLLGTYAPRKIPCFKLQFQLWYVFGVIMVTAYSSSLAARLTNKLFDKRIDSAEDFITANLTWGRNRMISDFSHYLDLSDPYAAQIPASFEYETNRTERHEKILKGNYAIYGSRVLSAFFPTDYVSNEDLKGYRLMRDTMKEYHLTFGVAAWLEGTFNQIMFALQEAGLVQYHFNNVLYRRMPSALREVLVEYDINDSEPTVLELTPFGVGFVLYFIGLLVSTIVFYLELKSVKGFKSIYEVLLDIKKKRVIRNCREFNVKRTRLRFKQFIRESNDFVPSPLTV